MGSWSVTMKMHSRENITSQFPPLNPCVVHHKRPIIEKRVVGRSKTVDYVIICDHDDCIKCGSTPEVAIAFWDKYNSINNKNIMEDQIVEGLKLVRTNCIETGLPKFLLIDAATLYYGGYIIRDDEDGEWVYSQAPGTCNEAADLLSIAAVISYIAANFKD